MTAPDRRGPAAACDMLSRHGRHHRRPQGGRGRRDRGASPRARRAGVPVRLRAQAALVALERGGPARRRDLAGPAGGVPAAAGAAQRPGVRAPVAAVRHRGPAQHRVLRRQDGARGAQAVGDERRHLRPGAGVRRLRDLPVRRRPERGGGGVVAARGGGRRRARRGQVPHREPGLPEDPLQLLAGRRRAQGAALPPDRRLVRQGLGRRAVDVHARVHDRAADRDQEGARRPDRRAPAVLRADGDPDPVARRHPAALG
jgi:hypothetical protein